MQRGTRIGAVPSSTPTVSNPTTGLWGSSTGWGRTRISVTPPTDSPQRGDDTLVEPMPR